MRVSGDGRLGGSYFGIDTDYLYQTAFRRHGSKDIARDGSLSAVSCFDGCDIISMYLRCRILLGTWLLTNIARLPLDKIYEIC